MDKTMMKNYLLRDKGFLKELYSAQDVSRQKRILYTADDGQLNTLLKYLHFLANGEIEIKKSVFEIIDKSKKLKLITAKVEKIRLVQQMVNGPRTSKIKFLTQLCTIFSALLYPLFNED
jgi:hypothetical protein